MFYCTSYSQIETKSILITTDRVIEKLLNNNDYLTGGVISVVNGDSLLFNKGYGFADRENNVPFNANSTTVQIASVTKLITTTAVLQLMEQGKISLEDPVSKYFNKDFINNPFEKPVLIKHLLTHTGGFDDRASFMEVNNQSEIIPLDIYNQKYLPPVVWEPGLFFNYSNYAFNLLAYIVQTVSGQKFEDYVKENILIPLEMNNSGIGYDPELTNSLMKVYKNKYDDNEEDSIYSVLRPLKYTNIPGADDFKTTSDDMANLMLMYLNDGNFKGKQILKSSTIKNAFDVHFTYDKMMPTAQGLGWRIMYKNGIKLVYHDGDSPGIESSLVLFPEARIGLFTTFNNEIGNDAKNEILDSMFNIIYPSRIDSTLMNYKVFSSYDELTGAYLYMNDGQRNFEKIQYLFDNGRMDVTRNGDTIVVNEGKYLEVQPLLFNRIDKPGKLKFILDNEGNVTYFSFGSATYKNISIWKDPSFHRWVIVSSLILICISLAAFIIGFLVKVIKKKRDTIIILKRIKWIHFNELVLVLFFAFFIIFATTSKIGGDIPDILKLTLAFPLLSLVLLPFSIYTCYLLWKEKCCSIGYKILLTLSIMSIITITIILEEYNFIGYHFY